MTKRKSQDSEFIPRPRNKWIIYSSEMQKLFPDDFRGNRTKAIAERWSQEPKHVKDHYAQLSKTEEATHKKLFPNYRYSPAKKTAKKRTCSCHGHLETPSASPSLQKIELPAVFPTETISMNLLTQLIALNMQSWRPSTPDSSVGDALYFPEL